MDPFIFVVVIAVVAVTSLIKMDLWSSKVKVGIATAVSVVGAGVYTWISGDLAADDLMSGVLQVFGGSQLLYKFILEGTSVDDALEHVGAKYTFDESQ